MNILNMTDDEMLQKAMEYVDGEMSPEEFMAFSEMLFENRSFYEKVKAIQRGKAIADEHDILSENVSLEEGRLAEHVHKVEKAIQDAKWKKVISLCNQGIDTWPTSNVFKAYKKEAEIELQYQQELIDEYTKKGALISEEKRKELFLKHIGEARDAGDWEEVIDLCKEALEIWPEDEWLKAQLQKAEKSHKEQLKSVDAEPFSESKRYFFETKKECEEKIKSSLQQQKLEEAVRLAHEAIKRWPDDQQFIQFLFTAYPSLLGIAVSQLNDLSLEELTYITGQNAKRAGQADQLMKETNMIVADANESITALSASLEEISKESDATSKVITTIGEIASQINLLALNAAVEAARAGEAGTGFSIIADEIRRVAIWATEAAKDTEGLTVSALAKISSGLKLITKTTEEFNRISISVSGVSDIIKEIMSELTTQSHELDHTLKEISRMEQRYQLTFQDEEGFQSSSTKKILSEEKIRATIDRLSVLIDRNDPKLN